MTEVDAEPALAVHVVQNGKGFACVGAGEGLCGCRMLAAQVVRS